MPESYRRRDITDKLWALIDLHITGDKCRGMLEAVFEVLPGAKYQRVLFLTAMDSPNDQGYSCPRAQESGTEKAKGLKVSKLLTHFAVDKLFHIGRVNLVTLHTAVVVNPFCTAQIATQVCRILHTHQCNRSFPHIPRFEPLPVGNPRGNRLLNERSKKDEKDKSRQTMEAARDGRAHNENEGAADGRSAA